MFLKVKTEVEKAEMPNAFARPSRSVRVIGAVRPVVARNPGLRS